MTRTRELTFFFFLFFLHGCSVQWAHIFVIFHSCQHLNVNIPNMIWTETERERLLTHLNLSAMLDSSWLLSFCFSFFLFFCLFFFFGCFSNMQNQANCLSVNIICDFSCTYTFYVLSDWVNRDSKQKPAVEWFPQKKRERERNELGPSLMLHIGPTSHHHRPISRPPGAHKLLPDTMNISWWHSAQWKAPFHPSKHFK